MKRIKFLILVMALLLIPSIVNAEGNVSISKIEMKETKGDALEISKPTFEGLNVNYDLSFHTLGDSITYVATLKNGDKEEYKIANKSTFSDTGYMEYTFAFSDNSNIIKPNETKDMYITIKYTKPVPDEKLVSGVYVEQNKMNLVLINNRGQEVNPNTASPIIYIIAILLLLTIGILLFKQHKKISILLIALSLLLPITTYALKEITVTLNTKVEVVKHLSFCVESNGLEAAYTSPTEEYEQNKYYDYETGMTLQSWKNSEFNKPIIGTITRFLTNEYKTCAKEAYEKYGPKPGDDFLTAGTQGATPGREKTDYELAMDECREKYTEEVGPNSIIRRSNEGCYAIGAGELVEGSYGY